MAEVDSLKAVLEMKTEEIHGLRLEKAKLEDKLEDFDRMKVSHGKYFYIHYTSIHELSKNRCHLNKNTHNC